MWHFLVSLLLNDMPLEGANGVILHPMHQERIATRWRLANSSSEPSNTMLTAEGFRPNCCHHRQDAR